MAELIVNCPEQPESRHPLTDKSVVIGRGEDVEVFIAEKRASRRHVRVRPVEGGGWVAEEMGSSNGTFLGEQRILRRLLEDGDELRIGDTLIRFLAAAPAPAEAPAEDTPAADAAPAVVIGGTLDVRAVTDSAAEAIPQAPAEETPEPALAGARNGGGESVRRGGARPARSGKGLVFVIVAAMILVGEHFFLGAQAEKANQQTDEQAEYFAVLRHLGDPYAEFRDYVEEFEAKYPSSPFADSLQEHLTFARDRDEHHRMVHLDLKQLLETAHERPASIVRTGLMDLRRKLPEDEAFVNEIRRHIAALDRRRESNDQERVDRLRHQVQIALEADNPGRALRLLASFRRASPGMTGTTVEQLGPLEARAKRDVKRIYDEAWAAADKTKTPEDLRAALKDAYAALVGTEEGARIENRIRDSIRASGDPDYPTHQPDSPDRPDGTPRKTDPSQPTVPGVGEDVLTLAERGQSLILGRSWVLGRKRLAEAIGKIDRGRIKNEWERMLADTDRVIALANDLGAAAKKEKPPKVKLSTGRVTIVAADADKVTWRTKAGEEVTTEWSDVADEDVLPLIVPSRPKPEQRLAAAIVAADLSAREVMVELLIPLFEKEKLVDEASRLVAWRMYGRHQIPEGGYQVYRGDILDQKGYERAKELELIEAHRARADVLLAQIAKQKVFRKLAKMKEMRAELDKRREYALLAIFNEKHYPYPANKSSKQYQAVQKEIDRRIDEVREIWDDPYKINISRKGQVGKLLGEFESIVADLDRRGQDVRALKASIQPYAMYVTDKPITVRMFYLTQKEKTRLEYSAWVMDSYNPARTEYGKATELRQTRVTNDYRVMMGYQAQVRPGGAAYDAIDDSSVKAILDAGTVLRLTPIRAVRVDNRLVEAARLHSLDMQKRGYFSHFSKPNPATGQGQTSPHERMQSAGYMGYGSSENIASGAGSPEAAHWMWRHSSGHHRNLISSWIDMGCGHAGRMWTQNFGQGGGARAVKKDVTEIQPPMRGGMPSGR